ncbi:MAG: hypothetical protein M1426_05000 [Patescibacteria group bacterium]|nr:hypothetical protein [Patescibacteria group bacterium]
MKEQGPINSNGLTPTQSELTAQANAPKLKIRRDIFMSGEPGRGEAPPIHHPTVETGRARGESTEPRVVIRHHQPVTPDRQREVREAWMNRREAQERGGEKVTREQIETEEKLIRMGILPVSGGSGDGGGQEPPTPPTSPSGPEDGDGNGDDIDANIRRVLRGGAQGAEMGGSFNLYLTRNDQEQLERDPFAWLESKFDMIYDFADQGQELNSPVLSQLQNIFTFASTYLVELGAVSGAEHKPSKQDVTEFISTFTTRLNLIFMRSSVDHKNLDGVKQMAERLQTHGLLSALAMENGNVHRMYTRMGELLEDKRLAQEDAIGRLQRPGLTKEERERIEIEINQLHIRPTMMSGLQDSLITEQFDLAATGVGPYSQAYAEAKALHGEGGEAEKKIRDAVESQIRRAVRTAYDVFVVSQRQAILVSRGHVLPGADRYMSDPAALMNVFNQEDLLTSKYSIYNVVTEKFLNEIKLDMARSRLKDKAKGRTTKELLDFGTRLFRDLYAVPDFFSSSWRVNGILRAIDDRLTPKGLSNRKDDFALFLRLKQSKASEEKGSFTSEEQDRLSVWERIAEIRPEEIIRLYRERAIGDPALEAQLGEFFAASDFDGIRQYKVDEHGNPVYALDRNEKPILDSEGHQIRVVDAFRTYDEFKKQFGPIVQLLRQNGYQEFRALRIGSEGFTDAEKALIKTYFDGDETKAGQLQRMFAQFTKVAARKEDLDTIKREELRDKEGKVTGKGKVISGQGVIYQLMTNDKFEDIYVRTLLVDDALLDILESSEDGIMPISKTWSSEPSTDALVRCYNDMEHAIKAGSALLNFVYKEDSGKRIEAAEQFAEETSQYNGMEGRAKCIRYTVGTLLNLSKQDLLWDGLGVGKLPFRMAMSKIEKIYGPQAQPISRDTLLLELDRIHTLLIAAVDTTLTGEKREKAIKDSDDVYQELRILLETTPKDMVKRRAISFLFFLILGTLIEAGQLGKSVAKEK